MPPDVRKVSDLPVKALCGFRGYARIWGEARAKLTPSRWGKATTAHQAAQPLAAVISSRRLFGSSCRGLNNTLRRDYFVDRPHFLHKLIVLFERQRLGAV